MTIKNENALEARKVRIFIHLGKASGEAGKRIWFFSQMEKSLKKLILDMNTPQGRIQNFLLGKGQGPHILKCHYDVTLSLWPQMILFFLSLFASDRGVTGRPWPPPGKAPSPTGPWTDVAKLGKRFEAEKSEI